MEIKTINDFDRAVEVLISWTLGNEQLLWTLKDSRDHSIRWMTLEKGVIENLPVRDIDLGNVYPIIGINRVRDMFFYQMQERTGMDFGFCEYFESHWRNSREYFLSGHKTNPRDNFNLCKYGRGSVFTTCEGTETHICHVLPDIERKETVKDVVFNEALVSVNLALREASEK